MCISQVFLRMKVLIGEEKKKKIRRNLWKTVNFFKRNKLKAFSFAVLFVVFVLGVSLTSPPQQTVRKGTVLGSCTAVSKKRFGEKSQVGVSRSIREYLLDLNHQLYEKTSAFELTHQSDKQEKALGLIRVASIRKKALIDAMAQDPESALNSVILVPKELQTGVQNCFEKELVLEGILEVFHVDFFEDKLNDTAYILTTKDGWQVNLHPTENIHVSLESGTKVKVKGILIDDEMIFDASRSISQGQDFRGGINVISQPGNPPVIGEQKMLVIPVYFQDNSPGNYSQDQIKNYTIDKMDNYFRENSYGRVSIAGDVLGWIRLPINKTCDYSVVQAKAIQAVDSQIYFPNYKRLVLVGFPCAYNMATVGQQPVKTEDGYISLSTTWYNNSSLSSWNIVAHELGHNFGNSHANLLNCGTVPLATSGCIREEYQDWFDVMGWGVGHFNAPHKQNLGWFEEGNILTVTTNGSYSIEPLETISHGIKALRIQRGTTDYLYTEFRQPIGYDVNFQNYVDEKSAYNGALLYITPSGSAYKTDLIDAKPGIIGLELLPGATVSDPATGAQITVTNKTTSSLTVSISVGKTDFTPPSLNFASPIQGSTISGTVAVSVNVSDESGIQQVKFYLDGSLESNLIWTDLEAPYEFSWDTTQVLDGWHNIQAKAYDRSGEAWGLPGNVAGRVVGFTVSNGVVLTPTPISTSTPTLAQTPTPSPTLAQLPTPTATLIPTLTPTSTLIPTPTQTPIISATPTPVQDNIPPTVSLTSPADRSMVSRNASITISASASDNIGVTKVVFSVDDSIKCTDTSPSYACNWKVPAKRGVTYTIQVRAYDAAANTSFQNISVTSQ